MWPAISPAPPFSFDPHKAWVEESTNFSQAFQIDFIDL